MRLTERMVTEPWQIERLDLAGYLERLGITACEPSRAALAELHEAHVRAFTFDNIDALLGRHPGVSLGDVQDKFVTRGRGGDPDAGTQQGRAHMVVEVILEGERLLCDPGFGMSLLRPIPMTDGAEDDPPPGWRYRLRRTETGAWVLFRRREDGWEVAHTTDELEVRPIDVVIGHHCTSTYPGSHFTTGLFLAKHLPSHHVTVTHGALTVRTPGRPTEHRPLREGEIGRWLQRLEVSLTPHEEGLLLARLRELAA